MKFNLCSRLNGALIFISVTSYSPVTSAAGISGGIQGIQILFLNILGFIVFSFLLGAIVLRANKKLLLPVIFAIPAAGFFYIWIVRSKYFDLTSAFNPWLAEGSKQSYIAVISYIFLVGFVACLSSRFKYQLVILVGAILIVLIEAVTTPGVRIYLNNNPLSGEIRSIKRIAWHYGRLDDGRIVYLENRFEGHPSRGPYEVSLQPLASDGKAQRYQLMFSREVDKAITEDIEILGVFKNPFHPLNYTQGIGQAIVLESNWVATDLMLLSAVTYPSIKPDWVIELLERGADPNYIFPESGASALRSTIYPERQKLLKILIESGGDVNIRFNNDDTPLHLAARHNHDLWALEYLLSKGADSATLNHQGESPLQIVDRRIEETTSEYNLERLQKMRALLLKSDSV